MKTDEDLLRRAATGGREMKVCILDVLTGLYMGNSLGSWSVDLEECEPYSVGVFDPGAVKIHDRTTVEIPAELVYEALGKRIYAEREAIGERVQWLRKCRRELEEPPPEDER